MANKKLKDVRKMKLDEIISNLKTDDILKIVTDYEIEFSSKLGELTISELLEIYDLPKDSLEAIDSLTGKIESSFERALLSKSKLRNFRILGHYETREEHLFPISINSYFYCEECKNYHCIVYGILMRGNDYSGYDYFIAGVSLDDRYTFINDKIRNVSDVYDFISKHKAKSSYPLFLN